MGEVWRARHRMLARPAAIKLIRPSLAGDGRPECRRRPSAGSSARPRSSPASAHPTRWSCSTSGSPTTAPSTTSWSCSTASMPTRCSGASGPTPPERAIYLLRQVCHSLSEAQSCGLVHRDIKPANIFLCRYGEEYDFVKVLDFGIVGAAATARATRTRCTRGRTRCRGTPAFIAPEQAMGADAGRARRHLRDRLCGLLAPDRPARVHRRHPDGDCCCSTPRRRPCLRRPGPTGRFRRHSTSSCCPAWPRTPRTGRSPPGSCRAGWPRWKARAPGRRSGRGSGGRRTSRREIRPSRSPFQHLTPRPPPAGGRLRDRAICWSPSAAPPSVPPQ